LVVDRIVFKIHQSVSINRGVRLVVIRAQNSICVKSYEDNKIWPLSLGKNDNI
jgi:hypothetical protein